MLRFYADLAEFEAQRRAILSRADSDLAPIIEEALIRYARGDEDWYAGVVDGASVVWLETFEMDHPDDTVFRDWQLENFADELRSSLLETQKPVDPSISDIDRLQFDIQQNRVTKWTSGYTVNQAADSAVRVGKLEDPGAPLYQQWVSSRDSDVRDDHRKADGQVVKAGEKFTVGGYKLDHPSQPRGPVELWINCRCLARPVSEDMMTKIDYATSFAKVKQWAAAAAAKPVDNDIDAEVTDPDGTKRIVVAKWSYNDAIEALVAGRVREMSIVDLPAIHPGTGITAKSREAIAAATFDTAFRNPTFGKDGDRDPRLVWQTAKRPEEASQWGAPLHITDDGRIYGHFALHGRCHGAFSDRCLTPPSSNGDFSRYLIGDATGTGIATGPIVMDSTHSVRADGSVKSYEWLANTALAVADVTVGRDEHGFWCAGRLRPGLSKEKVAAFRASTLSGEWLPYGHNVLLHGILAVNGPGYLVQRRQALAASGEPRMSNVVYTSGPACPSCGGGSAEPSRLSSVEDAISYLLGKV